MSHRKEQVVSSLKRSIAMAIERDLSDPRVRGMVSVTRVELSDDARIAYIYVSVIPAQYEKRTLAGLNAASGHIMTRAGKWISMRMAPHLEFRLDSSIKRQAEVEEAIRTGLSREQVRDEQGNQESTS